MEYKSTLYENIDTLFNASVKHKVFINTPREKQSEPLKISDTTPDILLRYGLKNEPMFILPYKISQGIFLHRDIKHGHNDNVNAKICLKALKHIHDPLMILNDGDCLVLYIDYDTLLKDELIVVIKPTDIGNMIVSIYATYNKTPKEKVVYINESGFKNPQSSTSKKLKGFVDGLLISGFKETKFNITHNLL